MKKFLAKSFILFFLLISSCISFYYGVALNCSAAFTLSTTSLIGFTAVYCAVVLGYKVGGSQLSLEPRVQDLEQQTEELKKVSTALYKALYVVSSSSYQIGGMTNTQDTLLESYLEPIAHLIEPKAKENAIVDLKALK